MKKKISGGDIHFIVAVPTIGEKSEDAENFDEDEVRRITRKEASKPLLLLRTG
jgi:hypothetical protein